MEQMNIDPSLVVNIDMTSDQMPRTVRVLRPVVFADKGRFCCLLGPDHERGIEGWGNTPDEALADWNEKLADRMASPSEADEVALFAVDSLSITKNDVW